MTVYQSNAFTVYSDNFVAGKKEGSKVPAPSTVLESLRVTLMEYKKRLDDTTEEVGTG